MPIKCKQKCDFKWHKSINKLPGYHTCSHFSYISWICLGLVLSPRSGIELGGTKIFIGGPCYDPNDQIVCRFNNTLETTAVYVSPEIAYCVTPPLYVVGLIQVELSLDGGTTFKYTGTFRSSELFLDILFRYRLFSHSLYTILGMQFFSSFINFQINVSV